MAPGVLPACQPLPLEREGGLPAFPGHHPGLTDYDPPTLSLRRGGSGCHQRGKISLSCNASLSAVILRWVSLPSGAAFSDRAAMWLKKSFNFLIFFFFPLGKLFNRPHSLAEFTLRPHARRAGRGKQEEAAAAAAA